MVIPGGNLISGYWVGGGAGVYNSGNSGFGSEINKAGFIVLFSLAFLLGKDAPPVKPNPRACLEFSIGKIAPSAVPYFLSRGKSKA